MKTKALAVLAIVLCSGSALADPPVIRASDGTYLGRLSSNPFDPESTSNPFGQHGSQFSPDSINNPFGQYGSQFSPDSVNNPFATSKEGDSNE
jgi:hypothetical protein